MINAAKMFLLDMYPSSGLGRRLKEILSASSQSEVELHEESAAIISDSFYNHLSGILQQCDPALIGIILSPGHLKQPDTFFKKFSGINELALPLLVVIENCNPDEAISLLKLGAADFITPPFNAVDVLPRIWRLIQHTRKRRTLTHTIKEELGLKQLVGESPVFLGEINKIPLMAKCDATVLITGETGTGKELYARAIHYLSPRAGQPFVPVNCGAIPAELVENELFGHVRGAFTGAATSQPGLIQESNGGTLFLDEIDSLPLLAQVKLLRFLQDKNYRMLGSGKMHLADVRVVAASNIKLEVAIEEGRFRRDLFYRLNVIPAILPPLRARKEDIPILAQHFLIKYASEFNKRITGFNFQALQKLIVYEWPGNVRELENIMERAVVFTMHHQIRNEDLSLPEHETIRGVEPFHAAKARIINEFEKRYIQDLLIAHQGNITKASKTAQKNRRAFWELIRKHSIKAENFKTGQV